MEKLIMQPKNNEQLAALKAIARAMKVAFVTADDGSPYDPEFVTEVLKGEKARKEGKKALRVDVENLWK